MKKIIFFSLLLIMSVAAFSQQTKPSPVLTKQNCLQKSKKQKTAAWILMGGGIVTTVVGYIGLRNEANNDPFGTLLGSNRNSTAWTILTMIGGVVMIGSIPLFIASRKNKRRAMSVSFKNETAPQIQKSSFVYENVPSLTLKINL